MVSFAYPPLLCVFLGAYWSGAVPMLVLLLLAGASVLVSWAFKREYSLDWPEAWTATLTGMPLIAIGLIVAAFFLPNYIMTAAA